MNVRKEIEELMARHSDDRELAEALGALGWQWLGETVRWWGPILYARNREVFLPLIEQWVGPWSLRASTTLHEWAAEVEANRDFRLYRTIYHAILQRSRSPKSIERRWQDDLLDAVQNAPDRAARRDEIEKRDLPLEIEDAFAARLYEIDPELTGELLIRRVDRARWWEIAYETTAELARSRGDEDLYFELYRKTFAPKTWAADVKKLAATIEDPAELERELERRHLTAANRAVDIAVLRELLESRGEGVARYVARHIGDLRVWGQEKQFVALAKTAREGGWVDVWSTVVRTQLTEQAFSAEVERVCRSPAPPWERAADLLRIAGAQTGWGEWRWFTPLGEKAAVTLYDSFALLCRTALAPHLRVDRRRTYRKLAERVLEAGDTEMFDLLAARAAVVKTWEPAKLGFYAKHYAALEPDDFATRAVDTLGLIAPPGAYVGQPRRKLNPVYAALFSDPRRYAPALDRARDLLEAPFEDSRRIGLQMIANAGDRTLAVANLDHLRSYLVDEASRSTRLAAFEVLALAAGDSLAVASDILDGARAALDLRRKRYPRDRLIELIGRILARWPELRRPSEQPVVYERSASW